MKNLLTLLFITLSAYAFAQKSTTLDPKLIGKWKAVSKIETDKTNGVVTDLDKEIYKAGEKSYEFTKKNTVIITQGFGKHQEELPAASDGNKLFIGKSNKNKTPYIVTISAGKIKLLKTETKTKKARKIIETEEVILQL